MVRIRLIAVKREMADLASAFPLAEEFVHGAAYPKHSRLAKRSARDALDAFSRGMVFLICSRSNSSSRSSNNNNVHTQERERHTHTHKY